MRYVLYAVEEWVDDSPDQWELATRFAESGEGSPLVWPTEIEAQDFIDAFEEATGCYDQMHIVRLTGESPV